jgi:hypothetical protein
MILSRLRLFERTVHQASPREPFLHFLRATACARRGDKEAALAHYTTAMDLDSRNGPLIKVIVIFWFSLVVQFGRFFFPDSH